MVTPNLYGNLVANIVAGESNNGGHGVRATCGQMLHGCHSRKKQGTCANASTQEPAFTTC
jgi:hypothetical protein